MSAQVLSGVGILGSAISAIGYIITQRQLSAMESCEILPISLASKEAVAGARRTVFLSGIIEPVSSNGQLPVCSTGTITVALKQVVTRQYEEEKKSKKGKNSKSEEEPEKSWARRTEVVSSMQKMVPFCLNDSTGSRAVVQVDSVDRLPLTDESSHFHPAAEVEQRGGGNGGSSVGAFSLKFGSLEISNVGASSSSASASSSAPARRTLGYVYEEKILPLNMGPLHVRGQIDWDGTLVIKLIDASFKSPKRQIEEKERSLKGWKASAFFCSVICILGVSLSFLDLK